VGIKVEAGMVFCSDSRTNSGVDQVHSYKKMFAFGTPGQRQFVLLASGNLATTQGVINQLQDDIDTQAQTHLFNTVSLHQTAEYVGRTCKAQVAKTGGGSIFNAYFILGGQLQGRPMDLLLIYPEGNYVAASEEEPFLQIGESKYGKPILDRIITLDTDLETAALCALVSMDSTIRSNLTVGPPIDIQLYEANSLRLGSYYHFKEDSEYLRQINNMWDEELVEAFRRLPPLTSSLK
jgi:putative proteasome-type protease